MDDMKQKNAAKTFAEAMEADEGNALVIGMTTLFINQMTLMEAVNDAHQLLAKIHNNQLDISNKLVDVKKQKIILPH